MTHLDAVRRNQEKKRAALQRLKVESGCVDCGWNVDARALDFDHRPGEVKLFQIGRGISQHGVAKLLAEAAKCDVVCANCHRIRTYDRGQHIVPRKAA